MADCVIEDMFIRFDMIHERDRRTDGHRMMAIAALMHSIARQKSIFLIEVLKVCKLHCLKNVVSGSRFSS